MALQTPTTAEISDNIIAQLEASLNQTIPLLPKSFLRVLAKALAGIFIILYKYGGWIFLQIFVSTAQDRWTTILGKSINPLIFWGRLVGVGDPVAATLAELQIEITVENQVGSLPSGTQLLNSSNGVTYILVGSVTLGAPVVQGTIRAAADQSGGGGAGSIGNLDPGAVVSFVNPIANVTRSATVLSQIVTGADAEASEVYRQRVIDRFQKTPQGGAYADYEQWAEEVAGIINAYPYTGGPGEVDVYVEATLASSGSPDGIPTAAQLTAVADSIDFDIDGLPSRRPANAFVNVLPIIRTGFDVRVTGLSVDNPASVQSQITQGVDEYLAAAEPFIDGLTIPPRKDRITRSALIGLIDGIVSAENGTFTTVEFNLAGTPGTIEIYILQQGEKAKSTGVTFS